MLATLALLAACERPAREERPPATSEAPAPDSMAAAGRNVMADSSGRSPEDAVATVRTYLTALRRRDYARAASLWSEGATAGTGDSAAFRRAHGDTTIDTFEVGEPGRMEAAAGSRYLEVPVTISGTTPDRPPLLLHGIVTLRRAVVDGATEAQRHWRIARIEWSTSGKPPQRP